MSIEEVLQEANLTFVEKWMDIFSAIKEAGAAGVLLFILVMIMMMLISFFIALCVLGLSGVIVKKNENYFMNIKWLSLLSVVPFVFIVSYFINNNAIEGKVVEEWKKEYMIPYINQLPETTQEVQGIKVEDDKNYRNFFEQQKEENILTVEIVYTEKDGIGKKLKTNAVVSYTLKEDQTPYLITKKIEEDLGFSYEKGFYNTYLYLPKNYSLTYH